jgi:hypothetical protein
MAYCIVLDMIITLFIRRWCILAMGGALLLLGLVVLYAHVAFAFDWVAYSPATIVAFYPGLPSAEETDIGRAAMTSPEGITSLSGQILIALGATLVSGWTGFALGSWAAVSSRQQTRAEASPHPYHLASGFLVLVHQIFEGGFIHYGWRPR